MREPAIVVELRGRLGNQLFCWAIGESISRTRNISVHYSARFADPALDIRSFRIPITWDEPGRFLQAYQRSNLLRPLRELLQYRNVVQERAFGFDPSLLQVRAGQTLRGHFQSPRYFEHLREEIVLELACLRDPSARFSDLQHELGKESWMAVQVRGGDYFKHPGKFEIVGESYFQRAIALVAETADLPLVVFSDDFDFARVAVPQAERFIIGGRDLSPAESLLLSSSADAMVGTNSTFSWWTGFLMGKEKLKVFPRKWFTSGRLSEESLFISDFKLISL